MEESKGLTLKMWLTRRMVANIMIIPAIVANYAFLYLAGSVELRSLAGLSIVTVGDLIALSINNINMDFNMKMVQRFQPAARMWKSLPRVSNIEE